MNYDYSSGEKYAKACGLIWMQEWVEGFDELAKAHGFTQAQVDVAIQSHLYNVSKFLFNPKTYTFKPRVLLASWFLFGRKK